MTEARVSELDFLDPENVDADDLVYIARQLNDQFKIRVREFRSSKNHRVITEDDDILDTDEVLMVVGGTNFVDQLTLPDPSIVNSRMFLIKNIQNGQLSVTTNNPTNIQVEFADTLVISSFSSVVLYCDGFDYFTIADISGSDNTLSVFDPYLITSDADGIYVLPPSEYSVVIQKAYGNLIAIDADASPYDEIDIGISSEWTLSQVGTFRLDLDVKTGQTFTLDNSIEGIADVTLPASGVASLLFDKPYGTSTWYVRQSI